MVHCVYILYMSTIQFAYSLLLCHFHFKHTEKQHVCWLVLCAVYTYYHGRYAQFQRLLVCPIPSLTLSIRLLNSRSHKNHLWKQNSCNGFNGHYIVPSNHYNSFLFEGGVSWILVFKYSNKTESTEEKNSFTKYDRFCLSPVEFGPGLGKKRVLHLY